MHAEMREDELFHRSLGPPQIVAAIRFWEKTLPCYFEDRGGPVIITLKRKTCRFSQLHGGRRMA